jgi:hypothetical protein
MRRLILTILLVSVLFPNAYGVDLAGGPIGFFASMGSANSIIDSFAADNSLTIPALHLGLGIDMNASVFSFLQDLHMGLGIRYLSTSTGDAREASIVASLAGLYFWTGYQFGAFGFIVDVGGYRGVFSFPAARYESLAGWQGGLAGSVRYLAILTNHLSLRTGVSLQWLPIDEMQDRTGQRYRERGEPFLDFSGLSVSILLSWTF